MKEIEIWVELAPLIISLVIAVGVPIALILGIGLMIFRAEKQNDDFIRALRGEDEIDED